MLSYVLNSATSYFNLPVDELDGGETGYDNTGRNLKHMPFISESYNSETYSDTISISSCSYNSPSPPCSQHTSGNKATINHVLSQTDLYHILGVPRSSRIDRLTLRRAYLSRSKACHPDKFPNNPEATYAFQKVSLAYDVLSKPSSKRLYDSRSSHSPADLFAACPSDHADETFRSVILGVFNDFLDGDLEMIRSLLRAVNDINPALRLGDEGIDSVLHSLQSLRDRAITCRTCILALHTEFCRLLEVQHAFRQLSYFDIRRRSRLTIRLARIAVNLPIALERAMQEQQTTMFARDRDRDGVGGDTERTAVLNKQLYKLLQGLTSILERMEGFL